MTKHFRFIFWGLIACVFLGLAGCDVPAENAGPLLSQPDVIPQGFWQVKSTDGVKLYQKEYKNGTPDFVQIVHLDQGAAVELLHGAVTAERPGKGVFGGNDARIQSQSLQKFWNAATQLSDKVFCVTNGQFFYMPESPTRLTLPLKVDGNVITDGFGADQFIGKRLMLELWKGYADIRELNRENLYNSSAPDILGGLSVDANRRAKDYTGRTFAGVQDRNGDGIFETLYIFNTRTARQVDADAVLKSFGAQKTIMLDGGGSTQLLCEGQSVISSERLIPQALAVIASEVEFTETARVTNAVVIDAASDQQSSSAADSPVVESEAQIEVQPVVDNLPQADELQAQAQVSTGIDQQNASVEYAPLKPVELDNLVVIPIIMIPVALIVLFIASRLRRPEEDY